MPDTTPSDFHVPFTRDALIHAALIGDTDQIDTITDRLAQQGLCRPRSDASRMDEWVAGRHQPIAQQEAPAIALTKGVYVALSGPHGARDGLTIGEQIAQQLRNAPAGVVA